MWIDKDLAKWVEALKNGDVVAAPAEGVYGYCADPFNPKSLEKINRIKQRDPKKGVISLIGNLDQLSLFCDKLNELERSAIKNFWQGDCSKPTTIILTAKPGLPELLTGGRGTVAVRLARCDYMQEYLQAWGAPLVSTSLNISGQPPVLSGNDIPVEVISLKLDSPLSGTPSQIFLPKTGEFIR